MPHFDRGDIHIYYEQSGPEDGFPVLLIAPGGMKSAIPFWAHAPWHPVEELADRFRVIAMDQRNAGRSSAPVLAGDSWRSYTGDQLGLMDHLGIERFLVAGMCIGGSYSLGLIEAAPQRVAAAVLFQPIGLQDNRQAFYDMYDAWAAQCKLDHPQVGEQAWRAFRENMYAGDFTFNVSGEFVRGVATPMLVLQGDDLYHPKAISRQVAELAPNARLIEEWKEGAAIAAARREVVAFLQEHAH